MASSSSSTFSSAVANSSNKSHQVFINHRGVDVKRTFARYLYLRLREKGLTAFLDDEELQVGYEISSQIADAIRTASVHVAIFSPHYAESEWCLNELLLMLKSDAPIIPVFYRVSPANVRWMFGLYGEALATHEKKGRHDPSTIEEWRNALHQVANNSGFQLAKFNGEDLVLALLHEVVEYLLEMVQKPDLYKLKEFPNSLNQQIVPSAKSSNKSHEVFINHRGIDVKETFASSLYLRLQEEGLTAFLDEKEIRGGYEISSQIADAIRTASVHVAIFSPRYAESDWCLNELSLMLKSNAPIVPVFYRVRPASVRWLQGDYGYALRTHEEKGRQDPSTIEEWKNALHQVANNSGFELQNYNGEDLVLKLLDEVVKHLLKMLQKPDLYVAEYPTGLDDKLKDFEDTVLLTQQQRWKPQILGIVGLGGVGKTTLAKAFFNKKKSEYDGCCFLCDVRDHATNRSLNSLQSQLLNSLTGFNKQVNSVLEGKGMLIEPLKSCKAIVILDDVDDVDQVKAFLPRSDVFNPESLILITTRDKNVLRSSKVENSSIYSLSGLNKEQSSELFCSHAFSQAFPLPEFKSLVDQFIDYCNGLPLSLKIFGALLYGKDISQWQEEWDSLRQIVPSAIQDTFKISYNSLNQEEKDIFLDIACFFRDHNRDAAISIWNSSGWRGNRGFLNLQDKSLVEVDDLNFIQMHDHLRDLGRQVAASSLPRRLLITKNLIHNLSHQSSEITFRGIRMVPGEYSGQDDDDVVFGLVDTEDAVLERSFKSVQILDMEGCHLEPILRKAKPPNLSCLSWNRCPHSSLPSWVSLKNLRILTLYKCELMALLWNEKSESQEPLQFPIYLEELRVSQCEKLRSITGLERATKLRLLEVPKCSELEELPSLETLVSLEYLTANGCKKLKGIRASAQVTKLRILDVRECSELEELPSLETLVSLEQLWADGCKKLKGIRASAQVTKLRILSVSNCSELEELPSLERLMDVRS